MTQQRLFCGRNNLRASKVSALFRARQEEGNYCSVITIPQLHSCFGGQIGTWYFQSILLLIIYAKIVHLQSGMLPLHQAAVIKSSDQLSWPSWKLKKKKWGSIIVFHAFSRNAAKCLAARSAHNHRTVLGGVPPARA